MKKWFVFLFFAMAFAACNQDEYTYALIETEFGNIKVKLYNTTPQHRDNFIKLANEGFFDGTLFHRVIPGFMIQGGDPDSKTATPGQRLGMGSLGYEIEPEIGGLHLRGALAAARTPNPQKRSSASQFYIVDGSPVDTNFLNAHAARNNAAYSAIQKELYVEMGGRPDLDFNYTVFGEVVEGMEVVDQITAVTTDPYDRPTADIPMKVRIVD